MTARAIGQRFYTASELAQRWGLPREAVIALIDCGDLAAHSAGNTKLIYTRVINRFERERSRHAPDRGKMVYV
jgi:hypothetical protein